MSSASQASPGTGIGVERRGDAAGAATAAAPMTGRRDRRRHPRRVVVRPCKVFRPLTQRYVAAHTRDASRGGVSLEIDAARPLSVGERVGVGIAWSDTAVIAHVSLAEGVVVRTEEIGPDRQRVAVRYDG